MAAARKHKCTYDVQRILQAVTQLYSIPQPSKNWFYGNIDSKSAGDVPTRDRQLLLKKFVDGLRSVPSIWWYFKISNRPHASTDTRAVLP